MISETSRLAIIKDRHKNKQPLNLSAVAQEAPQILEGLFDPDHFIGWHATLEKAGLSYDDIYIHPSIVVTCQICGFKSESIVSHIHTDHEMTSKDYLLEYPYLGETSCEDIRIQRMGHRHGKKAKTILPHWEPAWSLWYALDRIQIYHQKGISLNYQNIAKNEPGLAAYCRRCLKTWDAALAATGLNVDEIREAKHQQKFTAESLVATLKKKKDTQANFLTLYEDQRTCSILVNQCFVHFKSYEVALKKAGIDPALNIPALRDPEKVKKRDRLIEVSKKRIKSKKTYNPQRVQRFIVDNEDIIYAFYGSWHNFFESINTVNRVFFNSPDHLFYDSEELVIQALKKRHEVGLDIRDVGIRVDDPSLLSMVLKHFQNSGKACKAAGNLPIQEASFHLRHFKSAEDVIAVIQKRYTLNPLKIGSPGYLGYYDMDGFSHTFFVKWAKRYFGSYENALKAAKVKIPPTRASYHSKDDVVKALQKRFKANLGMRRLDLLEVEKKGGDYPLDTAIYKYFKSYSDALKSAAIAKAKRRTPEVVNHYPTRDLIVKEIQARVRRGQGVRSKHLNCALKKGGDLQLSAQILVLFGGLSKALQAAGVVVD